jgi:hypothetical protein
VFLLPAVVHLPCNGEPENVQWRKNQSINHNLSTIKKRFLIVKTNFNLFKSYLTKTWYFCKCKICMNSFTESYYKGKWSLDRISLDRNCHFSLDRKF